jgi:hypothetical protein
VEQHLQSVQPGNMKRYLAELVRFGYIKANGNRYRKGSYEYMN